MEKIKEMAAVMQTAAQIDDEKSNADTERLTQLILENKVRAI